MLTMNTPHQQSHLPDISVVVSCFNQSVWVERCLRTLFHQNSVASHEFEILLVGDGSTDRTLDVLKNFSGLNNLRIIRTIKNQSSSSSLNAAIQKAQGRYVVRVDSDDYVQRNFLAVLRMFLDLNRHYQGVAADYVKVDAFERVLGRSTCFEEAEACGILFRKECLFEIGLYDSECQDDREDEFRKRFEKQFKIARLEFPFYRYQEVV